MIMNPYAYETFTAAIATAFLGMFVLMRDFRKELYRTFALYSISIAFWAFISATHTIIPNMKLSLILARVMHIGVIFIPIFFTRFVLILTDRLEKDKWWLYSVYFSGLLLLFLLPNPLFVNRVVPDPPLRQMMRGGPLYILVILFFYLYSFRSLFTLYVNYRNSQADQKRKLGYLFWSSMLGYGVAPLTFLYCYDIPHPMILSYVVYTVPIYTLVATYAIIRHHLLDINIVFKRSLVYSILVASITLVYLIVVWFSERAFQIAIGYRSLPTTILALLTISIIFQPLKNCIQRFVDFRFFKGTLETLAADRQKLQEEIRRTDQLRIAGALATGLAHEIKNPLTSIKTFTRYLPGRKNEEGFIEKFQEVIENEANRIEKLTKDLLDFAKPMTPNFSRIDLNGVLNRSLELVRHELSVRNIKVFCLERKT